jgi:serine/tyrosine/threonine adenylyltransferase
MLPSPLNETTSPSRPRLRIPGWEFSNSYAALPARFFARVDPAAVTDPRLIKFNGALATELGLEWQSLDEATLAAIFAGNVVPVGADPIATAYAGHQFGQFVPQLGDGRALLLGEVIARDGSRRDIQLKGSGRTPFSRSGDGRAALGPVLREYLVSESMHSLGIATTRSLAAVTTGEPVFRGARLPGAVVTRVAASHVRVGTFEYFAARGDAEAVRRLADYVIDRHYPELKSADRPYAELLAAVVRRQAALIAGWMGVGFIHGVMNTDNTAISGETIDFGPCAFMDGYDPATVFSSIDSQGRYAYGNQPAIAQWNMARFAETLLTLLDPDDTQRAVDIATPVVDSFREHFEACWIAGVRRKLGLVTSEEGDPALVGELFDLMLRAGADYTLTFRRLCEAAATIAATGAAGAAEQILGASPPIELAQWIGAWRARLARDPQAPGDRARAMRMANPAYIPRNHRVEAALAAATERADFGPFEEMLQVLSRPYEEQPGRESYVAPPLPAERVLQTFCGT